MTTTTAITPALKSLLRRVKLGKTLDTLLLEQLLAHLRRLAHT